MPVEPDSGRPDGQPVWRPALGWHDLLMIDWRVLLVDEDGVELQPAASEAEVVRAEALLGAALPAELRALYLATDGVFDKPGQWFVVWPLAEVITRNLRAWAEEPTDRRELVGFGDDGTGATFCVPRDGGGVLVWNTLDGQAYRLADSVAQFWSGWSSGSITT
jgi:SMI1 / KNR4 family (SUKH-1)